jgi:hypothetical protein
LPLGCLEGQRKKCDDTDDDIGAQNHKKAFFLKHFPWTSHFEERAKKHSEKKWRDQKRVFPRPGDECSGADGEEKDYGFFHAGID